MFLSRSLGFLLPTQKPNPRYQIVIQSVAQFPGPSQDAQNICAVPKGDTAP